tara:strand:- start:978 stop:2042 length:1065 start_codon:yes stop_codon:yes gene_type:complete
MPDNYERELLRKAERSKRVRPNTVTPAWKFAEGQARQGLRNIQFGIEGDGSLNRRRLLQDITLAGLPAEQEDILLKQAASQADEMVDRQFSEQEKVQSGAMRGYQIGAHEREAEDRKAVDPILPSITQQATEIINSNDPLEVRFRNIAALQVSRPDMLQNKYYSDTFKTFTEALKNENWARSSQGKTSSDPDLARIEGIAKRMAAEGNVTGVKALKEAHPDYGKVLDSYILEASNYKAKPSTELKSRLQGHLKDIALAHDATDGADEEIYDGITRKVRAVIAEAEKAGVSISPKVKTTLKLEIIPWDENRETLAEVILIANRLIEGSPTSAPPISGGDQDRVPIENEVPEFPLP